MRGFRYLAALGLVVAAVGCGDEPSSTVDSDADLAADCAEQQSRCAGVCTNLDVDPDNCGRCELPCGTTELCVAGNCEPASGACALGQTECGGECVDLRSDPANCGACGLTCDDALVCQRGGCVEQCDSSLLDCGGACVDPGDDPAHCGASGSCAGDQAGVVCEAPASAIASCFDAACSFECLGPTVRCADECTDLCRSEFDTSGESVFEVTPGCRRVRISAWGAGGGSGAGNNRAAGGGFAEVEIAAEPGELWTVVVGAPGVSASGQSGGAGGAPGGGAGSNGSNSQGGGGGGGFSAVFRPTIAVENALVIAGGGGGSGGGGDGGKTFAGAGGGLDGENSRNGIGGTQTDGFAQLIGGPGAQNNDGGGGGGAGFFGGTGGSGANSDGSGGGGGSGFVAPDALASDLQAGSGVTPGNAAHPLRGTGGNPLSDGKVVIDCIPE